MPVHTSLLGGLQEESSPKKCSTALFLALILKWYHRAGSQQRDSPHPVGSGEQSTGPWPCGTWILCAGARTAHLSARAEACHNYGNIFPPSLMVSPMGWGTTTSMSDSTSLLMLMEKAKINQERTSSSQMSCGQKPTIKDIAGCRLTEAANKPPEQEENT